MQSEIAVRDQGSREVGPKPVARETKYPSPRPDKLEPSTESSPAKRPLRGGVLTFVL